MKKSFKIMIVAIIIILVIGAIVFFVTKDKNEENKYYEIAKVEDYKYFVLTKSRKRCFYLLYR